MRFADRTRQYRRIFRDHDQMSMISSSNIKQEDRRRSDSILRPWNRGTLFDHYRFRKWKWISRPARRISIVSPGISVILVQYGPNHSYDREWVYNDADIDASKVV